MKRNRNTQSLPKINGSGRNSSPDYNTINGSSKIQNEVESVTSAGKVSTERKIVKPKPKKLKPIRRKQKSNF